MVLGYAVGGSERSDVQGKGGGVGGYTRMVVSLVKVLRFYIGTGECQGHA